MTMCARTLVAAAALSAPLGAMGQVLQTVTFDGGQTGGWTLQNSTIIEPAGGNPGPYIAIPAIETFGVTLANRSPLLTGDLTRYGNALTLSLDWRTFTYSTIFGDPLDPNGLPLVLELVDEGDPGDPTDNASVFYVGEGMPSLAAGWDRREYTIPFPVGGALPAGWGGSGAEDPVTFEPILPPGRTYANVLASIDEVRVTTFQPGFFYGFRVLEVGVDNIQVSVVPAPGALAVLALGGLVAGRRRRA